MATRFTNESTDNDSAETCQSRVHGPDCLHPHSAKVKRSSSAKSAKTAANRSSRKKHLLLMATLGFLLSPAAGCTMMSGLSNSLKNQGAIDDFMIGYRNQAWAAKAWQCRKHQFRNKRYLNDFEAGFRAGYEAVAQGGNGCVPAVCPRAYWGWQYQTADGQARMNAWFEAFPLGVQAAEEDGIGHWSQMQTSMPMPAPMKTGLGVPVAAGAATAALSDQAELVPVPLADPLGMPQAETDELDLPAEPAAIPADIESALTAPPAPNLSAPAMPKPAPAVPKVTQPSSDPFGFD